MLIILLVLFFANYIVADELVCGPNQRVVKCRAFCPTDYCPTHEEESQLCFQPTECPPPACKCITNYRYAKNVTCIPTRKCPAFACPRINEVYNPCPPFCPTDSCTQATPTGECPRLGMSKILLLCNPSCRCKKGYWRVENGTCVPYNDCPGVSRQVDDADNKDPDQDVEQAEQPPLKIDDFVQI